MPTEEVIMVVVDCQEIDDDDPFNVQALGSDTSTFEEEDSFQGEMGMTAPNIYVVSRKGHLGSFAMTVDDLADVLLSAASSLDLVIFLNVGMTGVAQRVASCLPNAHCLAWDWDPSETPGQRLQWGLGLPHRMRLVRIVLKYLMYRPCLGEALDFANLRTLWRMCIAHQNPCVILPIRFLYDAIERLNITSLADAQAHAGHLYCVFVYVCMCVCVLVS